MESGNIRRPERLSGMCNALAVRRTTPASGMKTPPRAGAIPYACDPSFRTANPINARWTSYPRDLALRLRYTRSGCDGCGGWIQRIQTAGYGIGIRQAAATLEIDGSRERGLSGAVRACDCP